jgi:hypothetical protein
MDLADPAPPAPGRHAARGHTGREQQDGGQQEQPGRAVAASAGTHKMDCRLQNSGRTSFGRDSAGRRTSSILFAPRSAPGRNRPPPGVRQLRNPRFADEVLAALPIDVLKIDRAFVSRVADRQEKALFRAVVELARSMHLQPVAEGVETDEQAAALRELDCGYAQGFLFAGPMPADALQTLLSGQHTP